MIETLNNVADVDAVGDHHTPCPRSVAPIQMVPKVVAGDQDDAMDHGVSHAEPKRLQAAGWIGNRVLIGSDPAGYPSQVTGQNRFEAREGARNVVVDEAGPDASKEAVEVAKVS